MIYAIDSLRQLGMKYLEHAELKNFTFQSDILKPFVVLMQNIRSEKIRSLIVDCIVKVCSAFFLNAYYFFLFPPHFYSNVYLMMQLANAGVLCRLLNLNPEA